jgi:hypothetical protein
MLHASFPYPAEKGPASVPLVWSAGGRDPEIQYVILRVAPGNSNGREH